MVTTSDSYSTIDLGSSYAILPSGKFTSKDNIESIDRYMKVTGAKMVERDFSYNSETNNTFLTIEELKNLIKLHVDKNFYLND